MHNKMIVFPVLTLALGFLGGAEAIAHGGMGGFHGGMGGFRGGMGGMGGGFRGPVGGMGGFRGGLPMGNMGGFRGGGMPAFNRTPAFSRFNNVGGGLGQGFEGGVAGGSRLGVANMYGSGRLSGAGGADRFGNHLGSTGLAAGRFDNGIGNRSGNIGDIANRTNIGSRANIGNRTNIGGFGDRTNITNINRVGFDKFGGQASRWRNPYWWGYHRDWIHGYWSGFYGGSGYGWGWGPPFWYYGASLYNWGYLPYVNPYYVVATQSVDSVPYDYSTPIETPDQAPDNTVAGPANQAFEQARTSFQSGQYDQALQQIDQAIKTLPDDAALHEFRALVLFALGKYDEAAATLYAVLSVGPGWDWTTLISLYPDVNTYTAQLRALEADATQRPESAADCFVLAYQYLTAGHQDAAIAELQRVKELQPNDRLTSELLASLNKSNATSSDNNTPPAPAAATTDTPAPASGAPATLTDLAGTWQASPSTGTNISLTIDSSGAFTWKVSEQGRDQSFGGQATYGDGLLTLAQSQGAALVGRVSWGDASHGSFTFKVTNSSPDDPGLSFSATSAPTGAAPNK